jgi:ribosome-binding ATPase YchF (GTP1/OBG family)
MRRWEIWVIVALIGVLAYFWVTWPKPSVDERVKLYQKVIEEQDRVIDSLQTLLRATGDSLVVLYNLRDADKSEFNKTISRLQKQIQDNETIHTLPTTELDSIVRSLYGEGAI